MFHAADVHGSEKAFLKFLNAGKFYKAHVINLCGDLTGKVIVPIVEQADGSYRARFLGSEVVVKTKEELEALKKNIRFNGQYPYVTDPKEYEELNNNPRKVDELFSQLMVEQMERWIRIAEERLRGTGIKCFIMPGNDDRFEIDAVFKGSNYVINPEGTVVDVDERHEMVSTGYANITPWKSPRDIPEEELAKKIDAMVSQVRDIKNCIFNFHCPPYDTSIDAAPKLDEQFRPKISPAGGFEMIPVGSISVRRAIEKYQPLLGLHGHIHESPGAFRLGRTLCLNPGSEYSEGILRGVLVRLADKEVKSYMFTRS